MRILLTLAAACALGGIAWGADLVVERAPATVPAEGSPTCDGTLELKWDSGTSGWLIVWYTGSGSWVGNDFDISTISGYRVVESMRVYSGPAWPNGRWEGWRLGIYAFASVPGSLLWGPKYVRGTSSSYGWNDFTVNWTLPASNTAFIAAFEQFYDYPNCDAHVVDNNRVFLRHSWLYYAGNWGYLTNGTGYYNLMLRVIVNNDSLSAAPTSLGRIKGLYY
jgi:hypothetical protein